MANVSDKGCTENQTTHFVFSDFFRKKKTHRLRANVETYCKAWQAKDNNMAHAHCILDT
jgi:hypothetical protein